VTFQQYQFVLSLLGLFYASKVSLKCTWDLFRGFQTFIWPLLAGEIDLVKKFGSWAVITGCTDGIGKEYAYALAKRKLNVVLISRSMEKLQKTAADIEKTYGVKTQVIQADFSKGKEIYRHIIQQLGNKEIGILINNVGIMPDHPMPFADLPEQSIWEQLNINIVSTTMMARIILPQMVKRRRGAIINLASLAALKPIPLMQVYSATKVYVEYLSRCLHYEYSSKGIFVQTLSPCYIATSLVKFSEELSTPSFAIPTTDKFVDSAIRTIGYSSRTTGYWFHGLLFSMLNSFPDWVWLNTSAFMHRFLSRNHLPLCTKEIS